MERVRVRLKIYNLYQIMIFMDLKYINVYTKCPIKMTNSSEMKKFKRASRSRGVARPRAGKKNLQIAFVGELSFTRDDTVRRARAKFT